MITYSRLSAFSDNIAVITTDNQYTYKELIEYTQAFNDKLVKRSLVFCLAENSIGSLLGYLSFITNNIVPLMLDSDLDRELLNGLIDT